MDNSILFDLISKHLFPYHERLEKEDDYLTDDIEELRSQMKKSFTEEQLKIVEEYKHTCHLRNEYIDFIIQVKTLNYGVKIGMELQEFFDGHFKP